MCNERLTLGKAGERNGPDPDTPRRGSSLPRLPPMRECHAMCRCAFAPMLLQALLAAQQAGAIVEASGSLLQQVTTKLASAEAVDVATAAHTAQRLNVREAAPALRQALLRWRRESGFHARLVRMHLADALLQNGVDLPFAELDFLLQDALTRVPALLLLAQDVGAHRSDLAAVAMAAPWDLASRMAVQLLVGQKIAVDGLAAWLLPHAECSIHVCVADGSMVTQWQAAVGLGGGLEAMVQPPAGFPPMVRHELLTAWIPGPADSREVCASAGLLPAVLHRRQAVASLSRAEQQPLPTGDKPQAWVALSCLSVMAGVERNPSVTLRVTFRDAAQVRAEVDRAEGELRASLAQLVAALRRRGWLQRDEMAGFKLPFRIAVTDERGDQTVPLPTFDGVRR